MKTTIEKKLEYEELSNYVNFFATKIWGVPQDAPHHPSQTLANASGKVTHSKLLAGLKQAANDTIEASKDFSAQQLAEFDKSCRNHKILTLSEVRRRYWSRFRAVIEKQHLRNDTDYYLVSGILNDIEASISQKERELLSAMVIAYEQRMNQQEAQQGR